MLANWLQKTDGKQDMSESVTGARMKWRMNMTGGKVN